MDHCPFTQYMLQKLDKLSIIFWLATNIQSKYLLNGLPYCGKNKNRKTDENVGEYAVSCLTKLFYNTGRNVTTYNFFTPLKLAKTLRSKGISIVGTAKYEVLESFKVTKGELYPSKILTHEKISRLDIKERKTKVYNC